MRNLQKVGSAYWTKKELQYEEHKENAISMKKIDFSIRYTKKMLSAYQNKMGFSMKNIQKVP